MNHYRKQSTEGELQPIWIAALACFILAGATGALLRAGMLTGYPAGLQMGNIRHAHSHLMYFGWVTPALMALIAARLPEMTGRAQSRAIKWALGGLIGLALLAFVPFLLYGYRPAPVGRAVIPLSMVAASLNIVGWYLFIALYVRATRGVPRYHPLRLWDAALGFLVLASLGAWALAGLSLSGVQAPIVSLGLTHLFLDLFADGWFVLALLGLAYAACPAAAHCRAARWGETLLVGGLPLIFLLSLPSGSLPQSVRWLVGGAALLVAGGLLANVIALIRSARSRAWLIPLAFLTLKASALVIIAFPAGSEWASRMVLRVSYLHWLLLGFVTLGLLAAAGDRWGAKAVPARRWFTITTLILLLSLIPLTRLWPAAWAGRWTLQAAAWATVGPVAAASAMLIRQLLPRRQLASPNAEERLPLSQVQQR